MPSRARPGSRTSPTGGGILAQRGSPDYRAHQSPVITVPCPDEPEGCGALAHERCAAERYASGRASAYYTGPGGRLFHPARIRAARDEAIREACRDGYRKALDAAAAERRREQWASDSDPEIAAALALFDTGEPGRAAA